MVVGAASRDLERADPRGWRLGGGVTYAARALSGLGLSTGIVVGLDPPARDAPELEELRASGVRIVPVRLARGPVFENLESGDGRLQIAHQASDPIPAGALPPRWRDPCALLLAPVAGEIDDAWVRALDGASLVALDLQGLVRRMVPGRPVEVLPLRRRPLTERADLIAVSAEDLGGVPLPIDDLLVRTGQRLAVTRGPRGSLVFGRTPGGLRARFIPATVPRRVVDSTGAGDTFLAAWLAGTLALHPRDGSDRLGANVADVRALHLASLAGSLLVERVAVSREAIRARAAGLMPQDAAPGR